MQRLGRIVHRLLTWLCVDVCVACAVSMIRVDHPHREISHADVRGLPGARERSNLLRESGRNREQTENQREGAHRPNETELRRRYRHRALLAEWMWKSSKVNLLAG